MCRKQDISRRLILRQSAPLAWLAAGFGAARAQTRTPLEVAYAGSMTSLMEGPVKAAAAKSLNIELRGRAQGASGLATLIAGGTIRPDVFISVTPGPIHTVIRAGKAKIAEPLARTEMVIAYSPNSRFAADFKSAGQQGGEPWYRVLQKPGLRFGRTDPQTDPQGRNIIFVMQLAARYYKEPELVERVLGPTNNPRQIFAEPSIEPRLQSGELDAASAYKIQPGPFHIPWIALPPEINLSEPVKNPDITITVGGKQYRPEPLVYYAAVLNDAPQPKEAAAFVEWLTGSDARAIFTKFSYDPAGDTPRLRD